MSDQPMGPDWWMASDHKWYPPELHPGRSSDAAAGAADATGGASQPGEAPSDGTVVAEAGEDGWRVGPAGDPDRYTLHERHSRGNEGDLWRASLTIDDVEIPIALKVTHPEDVSDLDEAKARWQRQADLLGSLDHPGLVKVRELFFGSAPHRPGGSDDMTSVLCLAMNWVDGDRLDTWVKDRADRTLSDVIPVLDKVAAALDYLHTGVGGRPVLHRNLKPGNILVSSDDVRLVGFGTARLMKLDAQMTIVGTPAWMPPEVLNGDAYDQAADMWSLGAIAFYLACGSPPPLLSVDKARSQLTASSLLAGRPQLVDDICQLLDPSPANRPESAQSWVQAFLVHSAAPSRTEPTPDEAPVEPTPVVAEDPAVAPAEVAAAEPEPAPVAEPAPAAEPIPEPAADAAPSGGFTLDLGKPADSEPVAMPAAEQGWSLESSALDEGAPGAAEPATPGEPVWDEASQSWRDPASGSVWDPDTQTWSAPTEAPVAPEPLAPAPTPGPAEPTADPYAAAGPPVDPYAAAPAADAALPADPYAGAPANAYAADTYAPEQYAAPAPPDASGGEASWAPPPDTAPPAPAPPAPAGGKSRTPLIIGVVVALLVVIAIVVALLVL